MSLELTVFYLPLPLFPVRPFSHPFLIHCCIGLDIFFLAFISGASMNPDRSLAPAVLYGVMTNLWTATFIGTSIVALILRNRLVSRIS